MFPESEFIREPTLFDRAKEMDDALKQQAAKDAITQAQFNAVQEQIDFLFDRTDQLIKALTVLKDTNNLILEALNKLEKRDVS